MTTESYFIDLRTNRLGIRDKAVPQEYQGVSKDKIRQVLSMLDRESADMVDVVFSLLDDETPNQFSGAPYNSKFYTGATVAHIGSHVGILQRAGNSKLDREGRDYWIKPLRELGAIDPVYFDPETRKFIDGHPKPKSPNSAYRLNIEFIELLKAPNGKWQKLLSVWVKEEKIRERATFQALAQKRSEQMVLGDHKDLIITCKEIYAPAFLPNFTILFLDYEDGQRVTNKEEELLTGAGLSIKLGDPMPDILLWNPETDIIWIIEAVTTDGEVDEHKVTSILSLAKRSNKPGVGFTTAYASWNEAAKRQGRYKNISPSTYIWISEDPSKQYLVSEIHDELRVRELK